MKAETYSSDGPIDHSDAAALNTFVMLKMDKRSIKRVRWHKLDDDDEEIEVVDDDDDVVGNNAIKRSISFLQFN